MNDVFTFDGCRATVTDFSAHVTVMLVGDLDIANAADVRDALFGLIPECVGLDLDLSRLDFIDSTGLAALLRVAERARSTAVECHAINLTPSARRLIAMAGVERFLDPGAGPARN